VRVRPRIKLAGRVGQEMVYERQLKRKRGRREGQKKSTHESGTILPNNPTKGETKGKINVHIMPGQRDEKETMSASPRNRLQI